MTCEITCGSLVRNADQEERGRELGKGEPLPGKSPQCTGRVAHGQFKVPENYLCLQAFQHFSTLRPLRPPLVSPAPKGALSASCFRSLPNARFVVGRYLC